MKENILDLPFPAKGLFISQALDKQPPLTTPSALNVRLYNPRLGRDMGGQRSGQSKYFQSLAGFTGGVGPVQDINHLVTTLQLPGTSQGQFTVARVSGTSFGLFDSGGNPLFSRGNNGDVLTCSCWDLANNVYVAIYQNLGNNVTISSYDLLGNQRWNTTIGITAGSGGLNRIYGLVVSGTTVYVALQHDSTHGQLYRLNKDSGSFIDTGLPWKSTGSGLSGVFGQTLTAYNNCLAVAGNYLGVLQSDGLNHSILDCINLLSGNVVFTRTQLSNGGLGDITSDGNSFFYYTDSTFLTKLSVTNDITIGLFGAGAIGQEIRSVAFDALNQRLAVCGGANVFGSGKSFCTVNLLSGGIITGSPQNPGAVTSWQTVRPNGIGGFVLWAQPATNNLIGLNSALGVSFALESQSSTHIGNSVNTGPSLLGPAQLSQRIVRGLTVEQGALYRFASSGPTAVKVAALTPPISLNAPLFSTQVQQKMYYVDGLNYFVYDPATDTLSQLVPASGSQLPTDNYGYGARLCETWRNRLMLFGLPYDPLGYFASAVGDPTNYAYNPTPAVETEAFAGNLSSAGASQDIINCGIPYNDEIFIFGGDHTICQMTGDPAAGGRIDLVTDSVGMAWGRPWCRRPDGLLYFMSSHGSVYRWAPGGIPERISDAIAELLLTVNVAQTVVRMAWSERQRGFHLFLTNIATYPTAAASLHYFYDAVQEAWYQDQFANASHNPIAVHAFDGDTPGDRVVLLGGFDGFIRKVDAAALDDDGTAISSNVLLGPLKDKIGNGITLADVQCALDSASSPVSWSVFAGNSAQDAFSSAARQGGTFPLAGRNRSQAVRVFGHAAYVQLLGPNAPGQAWAMEYLRVRLRAAEGKSRQRIF